jgi:hypothetical protein
MHMIMLRKLTCPGKTVCSLTLYAPEDSVTVYCNPVPTVKYISLQVCIKYNMETKGLGKERKDKGRILAGPLD